MAKMRPTWNCAPARWPTCGSARTTSSPSLRTMRRLATTWSAWPRTASGRATWSCRRCRCCCAPTSTCTRRSSRCGSSATSPPTQPACTSPTTSASTTTACASRRTSPPASLQRTSPSGRCLLRWEAAARTCMGRRGRHAPRRAAAAVAGGRGAPSRSRRRGGPRRWGRRRALRRSSPGRPGAVRRLAGGAAWMGSAPSCRRCRLAAWRARRRLSRPPAPGASPTVRHTCPSRLARALAMAPAPRREQRSRRRPRQRRIRRRRRSLWAGTGPAHAAPSRSTRTAAGGRAGARPTSRATTLAPVPASGCRRSASERRRSSSPRSLGVSAGPQAREHLCAPAGGGGGGVYLSSNKMPCDLPRMRATTQLLHLLAPPACQLTAPGYPLPPAAWETWADFTHGFLIMSPCSQPTTTV
mmetsp:Transcript_23366/g.59916  ORF Transcript_23366/g.59916 Transcript_23366/m.59916 type:complete len:413 (-) Transcript_23366:2-1240(-)